MFRRLLFLSVMTVMAALTMNAQQEGQVLKYLSRHTQLPAAADESAAEVIAYDAGSQRAIFSDANANKITFVDMSDPSDPQKLFDVILNAYQGSVNSVAVYDGLVAVALEDDVKQNPGKVLFFDINGAFISLVGAGALPDMLTFTPDGSKVIVCNEGEPNDDYTIDPQGSVSIIDVSDPFNPVTETVFFNSLNDHADSLKAMGVRIFGPNATVAEDFEPEYATLSADGSIAYVALQENNALAVIDVENAELLRIVALGFKNHYRGVPKMDNYVWDERPILDTTDKGQEILLGGFSGLWFEGYDPQDNDKLIFLTHPDRGPNGDPTVVNGVRSRPFVLPDYQAEVIRFSLDMNTGDFEVIDRVKLFRNDTVPITGRPNMQAAAQGIAYTDEIPVDLYGNELDNDPYGADMEGIVVDGNGTWWMVDEYRPAIYHFLSTGELAARYVPEGTADADGSPAGFYGVEALPEVYAQRRANRGFEAVAIEGDILYAFIQSPIDNPDDIGNTTSRRSGWTRILAFNTVTKQVVGEYLYPLFERDRGVDKIGDAVNIGPNKFMVIERDSRVGPRAFKYIYDIDLTGATNLITDPPTLGLGETLETLTFQQVVDKGITPVHKMKSAFLPGLGYTAGDKPEGLAMIDSHTFAVINDNDFGVGSSQIPDPPTGLIDIIEDAHPVLGILSHSAAGLDASDRDDAININNWPLYGMYQPDAIHALEINGETYIITANEGDAREYDGFEEEEDIGDVDIDQSILNMFPDIQENEECGRLALTNTLGDLDGDGDYDQLFVYGARSFSIWNADGNLIWDSGEQFEQLTAHFYPDYFNASNSNNRFDNRSDNKGPEPESVESAVINDSVYAFIGLERIGHTMMFNITDPMNPTYVDYLNTRDFEVDIEDENIADGTLGDIAPETQKFVHYENSGNGGALLLSANRSQRHCQRLSHPHS